MSLYKVWASYKPTAVAANFVGDKGDIFYAEDGKLKLSDGVTQGGVSIMTDSTVNMDNLAQNIQPATDDTYDLGSPDAAWQALYVSDDGGLYVGDQQIKVNANNQLELPAGTQVKQADGTLKPVGNTIDPSQIGLQVYVETLVNTQTSNAQEGALLQLQSGNWTGTNTIDTQAGELVITGGVY